MDDRFGNQHDPAEALPENELEWLAFRYLANELGDDEQRDFEARLAEDERLQAALVRIHHLTEWTAEHFSSVASDAIKPPVPSIAPATPSVRESPSLYRLATMAAAVLIALGVVIWSATMSKVDHGDDESSVAEVWASTLDPEGDPLMNLAGFESGDSEDNDWLLQSALLFDDLDDEVGM